MPRSPRSPRSARTPRTSRTPRTAKSGTNQWDEDYDAQYTDLPPHPPPVTPVTSAQYNIQSRQGQASNNHGGHGHGHGHGIVNHGNHHFSITHPTPRPRSKWPTARQMLLIQSIIVMASAIGLLVSVFLLPKASMFEVAESMGSIRLIALGMTMIILLFGCLGFVASLSANRVFIGVYVGLVTLLFIAGLALVITALALTGMTSDPTTRDYADKLLQHGWRAMVTTTSLDGQLLCVIQRTQQCSGYSTPEGSPVPANSNSNSTVNRGCCAPVGCYETDTPWPPVWQIATCPICEDENDNRFMRTCDAPLKEYIKGHGRPVVAGVVTAAVFFFLQVVTALVLCVKMK